MTDQELLALFHARNETALEIVKKRYGNYCRTIAMNILQNSEDVEEVINDVLYKAWKAIPPDQPNSFAAYLGTVTRNTALDRYRSGKAKKRNLGEVTIATRELASLFSKSSEDAFASQISLSETLNRFLKTLSERERTILIARYFHFYRVSEIATQLHLTQTNVSVIINRTLKKLKEFMIKESLI